MTENELPLFAGVLLYALNGITLVDAGCPTH
jgi:hypothetical protein